MSNRIGHKDKHPWSEQTKTCGLYHEQRTHMEEDVDMFIDMSKCTHVGFHPPFTPDTRCTYTLGWEAK